MDFPLKTLKKPLPLQPRPRRAAAAVAAGRTPRMPALSRSRLVPARLEAPRAARGRLHTVRHVGILKDRCLMGPSSASPVEHGSVDLGGEAWVDPPCRLTTKERSKLPSWMKGAWTGEGTGAMSHGAK